MIGGAARGLAGERLGQALPSLPFPLRNHVGVQMMLGSELGQGLVADQGLQGDFGLELGGEATSFSHVSSPSVEELDPPNVTVRIPGSTSTTLREGARRLLQEALELEVESYSQRFQELRDDKGQRMVVRNGYHQERELVTGVGKVRVRQPRVHDRRPDEHFTSAILPPYLRRTPSIDALIPLLYLKGISTNAFPDALRAILGDGVVGLSATNIVRLKQVWEQEFAAWGQRDLHGKRYVYLWADALYFNVRLEKDRPCVLVVVGATADGHKELLAIQDGERESALSWQHLLQDLKARGLTDNAFLAVADGALGFWKAVEEVFPGVRAQQCWVHKTANVLDKLPKRVRPDAKNMLHQMYMADTRRDAEDAYDRFLKLYGARHPKGSRVSGEGPRRAVHLLRLPGRPLGAPANHQPHRVHLRHRPPSYPADPWLWITNHHADHGLQAGHRGGEALASAQRPSTHHPSRRRRHLRRWRTATQRGRLTPHGHPDALSSATPVTWCMALSHPQHLTVAPK